jgi:hypothetical protein
MILCPLAVSVVVREILLWKTEFMPRIGRLCFHGYRSSLQPTSPHLFPSGLSIIGERIVHPEAAAFSLTTKAFEVN